MSLVRELGVRRRLPLPTRSEGVGDRTGRTMLSSSESSQARTQCSPPSWDERRIPRSGDQPTSWHFRLLSGSDYVGRGYHHRGAHLVSSRELSCCGGRWQNILAIGRPNMMQRSSGRPRRDGGWRCRQQLGSNTRGDCPCGGAFSLVFSLEFSLRRFDR